MKYRFGSYLLDLDDGILAGPTGELHLRPKTFELLAVLVTRAPSVVSRNELLDEVWGVAHLSPDALAQAVSDLRRALGDDPRNPAIIGTVHRRGYRCVADVIPADAPNSEGSPESPLSQSESIEPPKPTAVSGNGSWPRWVRTATVVLGLTGVLGWLRVGASYQGNPPELSTSNALSPEPLDRSRDRASGPQRVAVADCTLDTGPELDWLAPGISDIYSRFLGRSPDLWVYPHLMVRPLLADAGLLKVEDGEGAAKIHRLLDAELIVICRAHELSDSLQVTIELWDGRQASKQTSFSARLPLEDLQWQLREWADQAVSSLALRPAQRAGPRRSVPLDAFAAHFRGRMLLQTDPASARELFIQAQNLQPRVWANTAGRFQAARLLGDETDMVETARHLRDSWNRPGAGLPYLIATGQPEDAVRILEKKRRFTPDLPILWFEVLQALLDAEQPAQLLAALEQLEPRIRDSWLAPDFRLLEGRAAQSVGDERRAILAARRAAELGEKRGRRELVGAALALESELSSSDASFKTR